MGIEVWDIFLNGARKSYVLHKVSFKNDVLTVKCYGYYQQSPDNFVSATAQKVLFFEVTLMNKAKSKMALLLLAGHRLPASIRILFVSTVHIAIIGFHSCYCILLLTRFPICWLVKKKRTFQGKGLVPLKTCFTNQSMVWKQDLGKCQWSLQGEQN